MIILANYEVSQKDYQKFYNSMRKTIFLGPKKKNRISKSIEQVLRIKQQNIYFLSLAQFK